MKNSQCSRAIFALFIILCGLWQLPLSAENSAKPQAPYDEARFPNGEVRPQYKQVLDTYHKLTKRTLHTLEGQMKEDLRGDAKITPFPRVQTEAERDELREGVAQRGRAILAFLKDHYSGKQTYRKFIPLRVINEVVGRTGDDAFAGKVDPETISFPYGPDIVRDPKGGWRVVEENHGFLGGTGDLKALREILLNHVPDYADLPTKDNPDDYYRDLAKFYKQQAKPKGGKVVFYTFPPYSDHEDVRQKKLMADNGVEVVTPNSKNKIVVTDKGVFLEKPGANGEVRRERVGYFAMLGEHTFIDAQHPSTHKRVLLDGARNLLGSNLSAKQRRILDDAMEPDPNTGIIDSGRLEKALKDANAEVYGLHKKPVIPGMIDAMLQDKVATNYTPGLDFRADKALYPYIEKMIEHYLHEKPILRNIRTGSFEKINPKTGAHEVDSDQLARVSADQKHFVIKPVDGRGGDGIAVGPKVSSQEFHRALARVKQAPWRYQWQEYIPLSVLEGNIVDIRFHSQVGPGGVYVSPTPWGRALPENGNGKVNVSGDGSEMTVMTVGCPLDKVAAH